MYNETLGRWHFWLMFIGFNLTFMPMHWLGLQGCRAGGEKYDRRFADMNMFISAASGPVTIGVLIFFHSMVTSWRSGPKAPLEPVARPHPRVAGLVAAVDLQLRGDAPGGRGAVSVRRARGAARGGLRAGGDRRRAHRDGEAHDPRHLQRDRRATLVDEIRRQGSEGLWPITVAAGEVTARPPTGACTESRCPCWPRPASLPAASSWPATLRRRPPGHGRGCPRDLLATYPTGTSGWMGGGHGRPAPQGDRPRGHPRRGAARPGARAARPPGRHPRRGHRRRRAGEPAGWSRRSASAPTASRWRWSCSTQWRSTSRLDRRGRGGSARPRQSAYAWRTALQAAGVQARGEVLDGDAADAARIARDAHQAQAVLVVATRRAAPGLGRGRPAGERRRRPGPGGADRRRGPRPPPRAGSEPWPPSSPASPPSAAGNAATPSRGAQLSPASWPWSSSSAPR